MEDTLTAEDVDHLGYLRIGYYVVGAFATLCGFFPIIHLTIGLSMLFGGFDESFREPEPIAGLIGVMFTVIPIALMGAIWSLAVALFYAARCIAQRRRRMVVVVIAIAAAALFQPVGTILGGLTLVVMLRPSVKAAFDGPPADRPQAF